MHERRNYMNMLRSFLPVGQGAFYFEQFSFDTERVNVVYDCGSSTDVHIVEKEIRNNFQKGETIDAVFISHLDEDHINGLPYLLKYCCVEKLFFPFIASEDRDFLFLRASISAQSLSTEFLLSFIDNPYAAISALDADIHTPTLYQVTGPENSENFNDTNAQTFPSGDNAAPYVFNRQNFPSQGWKYIPFNFRETSKLPILCTALKDTFKGILGDDVAVGDIVDLVKKDPSQLPLLKQAYQKVPGTFNTNSMTLLSLCENSNIVQQLLSPYRLMPIYYGPCHMCYFDAHPNGCLYTGDFDASGKQKWSELYGAYASYEKYIGCVQVPHHGSRYSYNHQLLSFGYSMFYIISAGERNKYRHPHGSVIRDILVSHKYPIIVTEHIGSIARFLVE